MSTNGASAPRRPRPARLPLGYRVLSNVVLGPLFGAATAFFGSLSLMASLFDKSGRVQHRIARMWARTSLATSLSKVTIYGEENLRRCPVAVYAANHTSYMDTPVIYSSLPFQFRILAKRDLWKLPFVGWHLNRSGQIPVNVDNPRASISSLSAGVRALKDGMPLFVFPEGGRTADGHPADFMSGAVYVAMRAQVPVVPIALVGVYDLLPMHTRHYYPGPLTMVVGEPIPTAGCTTKQIDELTAKLKSEISRLYYEHSGLTPREQQEPRELAPGLDGQAAGIEDRVATTQEK